MVLRPSTRRPAPAQDEGRLSGSRESLHPEPPARAGEATHARVRRRTDQDLLWNFRPQEEPRVGFPRCTITRREASRCAQPFKRLPSSRFEGHINGLGPGIAPAPRVSRHAYLQVAPIHVGRGASAPAGRRRALLDGNRMESDLADRAAVQHLAGLASHFGICRGARTDSIPSGLREARSPRSSMTR